MHYYSKPTFDFSHEKGHSLKRYCHLCKAVQFGTISYPTKKASKKSFVLKLDYSKKIITWGPTHPKCKN